MEKISENLDLENLLRAYQQCRKTKELIQAAFESAYEGIVITDPEGVITMINRTYVDFLGVDVDEVIGRHCTEVIENTRMHIVGKTGEAELAQVQRIKGGDMIAHRIPILRDGKVVAVVGKVLFQDVRELHALSSRVLQLQKELSYYKDEFLKSQGTRFSLNDIVGTSSRMNQAKEVARRVAASDTTVFIGGESGTGKELFAHAIHTHSHRKRGPFVKVNCAAIPEQLMESVLFGYEEGTFTGAVKGGRKGKFEMAHRGTIFLDEIGELPLTMQAKLLRVLSEKEVETVGGIHPVKVDVRVIAASNRDLEQMVKRGQFRQDLFHRLYVVALHIPPLRERREDISLLAEHLLDELIRETGVYAEGIDPDAMDALLRYDWPGNVREMKNVLERALHLKEGSTIRADHLPLHVVGGRGGEMQHYSLRAAVEQAEKNTIQRVWRLTNGDRERTIQLLGISKSGFYQKMNKYNLLKKDG
ncbi:sigma-54-dependent Fis family transcriptional regulator [Marinithermofilum abyssi]|uniref:Sigma-54-dependent Fis family transcriptional regulator n=1 Tax=Marinithermofilum abyssi TaxID=1571185 RepID=A0A8J2VFM9_9BACL|nr:sigma 54-interacting transcriptional regulator [Marinithermofilum abyssi]GGE03846.1 sigma-54-dependent Fis family transcriptional regulator [Marinithermofilum abyssi]